MPPKKSAPKAKEPPAKKAKAARGKFSFRKKGIFGTIFGGDKKGERSASKSALSGALGKNASVAKGGNSVMTTLALAGLKRDVLDMATALDAAVAETGSMMHEPSMLPSVAG